MAEENIRALSRSTAVVTSYTVNPKSNTYPKLYEAVSAGCLQRIADSLEKLEFLAKPIEVLEETVLEQQALLKIQGDYLETHLATIKKLKSEIRILKIKKKENVST